MNEPGKEGKPFEMLFDSDWFKKRDVLETAGGYVYKLKVLGTPKRKLYHILLQWITFGWFKAKYTYTVKVIDEPKKI